MTPFSPSGKAILIIATSEADANLFYATRFLAPDPFVFFQIGKKKTIVASDLEVDRARDQASVHEVLSSSHIAQILKKKGISPISTVTLVSYLLKERHISKLLVPFNFPIAYVDALRKKGFHIEWKRDPFFEERAIKTEAEIQAMTKALRATESAILKAAEILKKANIRGRFLVYKGKKLRSEDIKQLINVALMESNCIAAHTIISCYNDCVDPHNQGSGPLLANQSIIMDVFPHSSETKYFADITRTFVRGKASPKLKKIYAAVKEGQNIAFRQIRNGADGSKIHSDIMKYFDSLGFKTGEISGRMQGFFHGTGHGVGVEIHEPPRISVGKDILKTNQVVTVEPGLYYLGVGGVRLEDMVVVKKNGCVNLTKFPKFLEI
ncbi:MAG: aminopeptidase P family protein [Candidatus Omnitrophica bacterium]|nr:aminopeptidase P family protein [Candidatus Omnitrophota bacterium]